MLGFDKLASLGAWARLGRSEEPRRAVAELVAPPAVDTPQLRDLHDLRRLLADASGACEVLRFREARVAGIADHSDRVAEDSVFFAIPGHQADGARFASRAVGAGAVAVVAARPLPVPVPCFVVPDVRRAASRVADVFYRFPSRQIPVVGVTGTNGKTTVADLLRLCLEDDERPVGSLGTIEYRLGPRPPHGNGATVLPARTTTPGPIDVQAHLRSMVDRGMRAAVLEVSSHALDQGRTEAVRFHAAVFTNLTQDHLDYHGSMQAYQAAKARLFQGLRPGGIAVLPADDPTARPMLDAVPEGVEVATYAIGSTLKDALPDSGVHVRAEILHAALEGTLIRLRTPEGCVEASLPLIGEHNVRNALAGMTCAIAMDVGSLRVADAISRAQPVPGRLERVDDGRTGFCAFVDYAHTPDALAQVLRSLAPLTGGRLRLMFGCGGQRDELKRPQMGRIAAELADHVVLTHDNPRDECPDRILRQILDGARQVSGAVIEVCPDRRRAIRRVLGHGREGDVIVLAGKGHERGQMIGGRLYPFDDREEARRCLARR